MPPLSLGSPSLPLFLPLGCRSLPAASPLYPLFLEQQQSPVPDDEVALLKLVPQQLGGFLTAFQQPTLGGLTLDACPVWGDGGQGDWEHVRGYCRAIPLWVSGMCP